MDRNQWTKRELTVYKNGTLELAKAVVRQWQLDGCPKQDLKAIEYWKGVIKAYED
jgi:hypothetical protein